MIALLLCVAAFAATAPQDLRVECPGSVLPRFLQQATLVLERQHDRSPLPRGPDGQADFEAASGMLLAWLRLGRTTRARELLAEGRAGLPHVAAAARQEACCWSAVHHYWYLRSSGDRSGLAGAVPQLEAACRAAWREAGPAPTLAAAALRVQAALALGGLREVLEPGSGSTWTRAGMQQLVELERRFWHEDSGCFLPRPGEDDAAAPELRQNLLPCWIGMLTTSGDRTTRNARTTLQRCRPESPFEHCLRLAALTQFDGGQRMAALRQLLLLAAPDGSMQHAGSIDLLATGAAVDAALYSVTGLRTAAAPGLDEAWLRCKPALPPGVTALACRGLRHDGMQLDLWIDRAQEATLRTGLYWHGPPDAPPRLLIVQHGDRQWQGHLVPREPLVLPAR